MVTTREKHVQELQRKLQLENNRQRKKQHKDARYHEETTITEKTVSKDERKKV